MAKNANMINAKKAKNDEYYTLYSDVEDEINNKEYIEELKGKIVYCNCDDYRVSNIFKYFYNNFAKLELVKLVSTCFIKGGKGLYAEYDGNNLITKELQGEGSFDSQECIDILNNSDLICTNAPFSLFRKYFDLVIGSGKKFIVMGNQNALTCKNVFPYIKDGKVEAVSMKGREFRIPTEKSQDYPKAVERNGEFFVKLSCTCWFTNIKVDSGRKKQLNLTKHYYGNEKDYPKYDNYDAINVDRLSDIPGDYWGVMGVPITFLNDYCPWQFRILDARDFAKNDKQRNKSTCLVKDADSAINGKPCYARIFIQRIK